ncbi:uncharacterized protein LOC119644976 [Glossina fuscipes]|uniref:Uncharacterized protein LOC119644976 n=1 Tax=Glossina fuscipes TaxID=7396 RepID=A0A9C6E1Z2_9MUSC|nr:uncharacterized protein LOC119644976 [Glossina fuscipes]
MKLLTATIYLCLLSIAFIAIVSAVPVDESLLGNIYESGDQPTAQNSQSIFKLKKLKKLLLWG